MKNWEKEGYCYKRAGFTITPCNGFATMTFINRFGHEVKVTTKTFFEKDLHDLMEYAEELMSKGAGEPIITEEMRLKAVKEVEKAIEKAQKFVGFHLHKTYIELTDEEKKIHDAEIAKWNTKKDNYHELD